MHVYVCNLLPEVLYVFVVTVGLVNVRTYIAWLALLLMKGGGAAD